MKRIVVAVAVALMAISGLSTAQLNPVEVELNIFRIGPGGQATRATQAEPGDEVMYALHARNTSNVTMPAGIVEIVGPIPEGTTYLPNTATTGPELEVEYIGGRTNPTEILWTYLEPLEPGETLSLYYRVKVDDEAPPRTTTAASVSIVDDYTQAMFGHLGVIQYGCPEGDTYEGWQLICGETTDNFRSFQRMWDLYATYEDAVPTVPTPVTAWQRDESGDYSRHYEIGRTLYSVYYIPHDEDYADILIMAK